MSFALPESARAWQQRVRAFVDDDLVPFEVEAEMNGGRIAPEARARHRERARALRLSEIDVPRDRGGLELPMLEQAVIWEQLGRVTNGLAWCFNAPQRWMFEACSEAQIEAYVVPLIDGARHECYAITEAEAGSDVAGISTTARRDGDAYVVDGEKWHVTGFGNADYVFVQARIAGGDNDGADALLIVDADAPGIEVVRRPAYSHTYDTEHAIVRFAGVRVPAANLVGAEGDGMAYTYSWFRYERLMIAARCCGAAARLIDEATAFAKERRVGGRPLAEIQAIQFMLADSLTELWAARLMTYECAAAHDHGRDVKVLHARCAMAKLYASEMANRVADRVVQIFGGRGYMRENVAERFYRELRVDRIWEGTSEIQRLIVARGLAKRGPDTLLE